MEVLVLQSGSTGNCFFVRSGHTSLLIDAGISGRQAQQRLAAAGYDPGDCAAVLLTHDHHDHSRSIGVFARKFHLPVYTTRGTWRRIERSQGDRGIDELCHFAAGQSWKIGDLTIESYATPHDGVDGVVFVIDDGSRRLGILTDLGHVFEELPKIIEGIDAAVLESNYDPAMLESGPYSISLKRRIRGSGGHISNDEAAQLLDRNGRHLQWACLCHLSCENNTPQLAWQASNRAVGDQMPLHIAHRDRSLYPLQVEPTRQAVLAAKDPLPAADVPPQRFLFEMV